MKENQVELKTGCLVAAKKGTKDPDMGGDISGWQGRVFDVEELKSYGVVGIRWDSLTLKNMPLAVIKHCEKKGLDWQVMNLGVDEVEVVAARDAEEDVEDAVEEIYKRAVWFSLGKEGERIQQVLDGIDPDDEPAQLEAWESYLEKNLKFPFEAEVREGEHRGRIRIGNKVTVTGICETDDLYGLLVSVLHNREPLVLPLCDLEAKKNSANYRPLRAYVVWFANR